MPSIEISRLMNTYAPGLIWISGPDKECFYFNDGWLRFTGRTLEQERGNGWAEGIHPDDLQRRLGVYGAAFEAREEFKLEYRLKRHDGQYRWLLDKGVPYYQENGDFAGYIGTCMDIDDLLENETLKKDAIGAAGLEKEQLLNEELSAANEELTAINEELLQSQESLAKLNRDLEAIVTLRTRALAESESQTQALNEELTAANEELRTINEDLAESEHRIRNIIENAPFPIAVYTGREMLIRQANEAIITVWGKGPDVIGKRYADLLPELRTQGIYEQLDQVLRTGIPFHARNQRIDLVVDGQNRIYYFNYSFTPLLDRSGEVYGVMNTAADVTDLAEAKQELEKAYEQLRLSKEAALLGTFDMNMVTGELVWDERCRTLFGISHKLPINYEKDFIGGLHPDDRERVKAAIAHTMDRGASNGDYDVEYRTIGSEEQLRWVRARGKAYFDENNQPVRFVGSVLDITDQKLNEQRLRENAERQARLAAIVDTSDDTIVSKTPDGIITSWNRAAERMFGYTQKEAIGRHISLIIPKARLKEEEYIIGQIRSGNKVDHFETIRIDKNGKEIPISLTISPIIDENGRIIGASKIARDISTVVAAQETARRYLERLEIMNLVVESISEELDLNKILQKVTDATTQLTGAKFGAFFYNKTDEQGESYMLYTLSGAPREAFEKFGMPRNTAIFGPTFTGEGVVRSDDITKDPRYGKNAPYYGMPKGHLPVVSYLAVPVISRSGKVIGGLFFGHDEPGKFTKDHESLVVSIAAQAAIGIDNAILYEEVKALNDKKDEFIGLASHELKTPLTSIGGYLQILSRISNDDNSQKFINKTLQQLKKLTTLVNDLLDVSKIEAGKLQLDIEEFNLVDLVTETVELIGHSSPKHQLILENKEAECRIRSDERRIEQVLINLLTNAIKYSPGADKVSIILECGTEIVKIGIRDFGNGIPADKLPHIFSRFYRVEDANPNISGLGIGLYLSQEIITRLKGKLWAESELGKGSTFWFELPLHIDKVEG
jgi:PAS domain S-box-containing protein